MKTRQRKSFLLIAPILATGNIFTPEASIDGFLSKIIKSENSYVRAGEIIALLDNKDGSFSFDEVPVRAPISGYIKSVYLKSNSPVKKGQKLFTITPDERIQKQASTDSTLSTK